MSGGANDDGPTRRIDPEETRLADSSSASQPVEDLSGDRVLRGCATIDYRGAKRPSVGRVALLSFLGKGGMGVVYRGIKPMLGAEVAVKILPWSQHLEEQGLIDRFVREARLAAKLRSEHLVAVMDVDKDTDSGNHYLVMEYVHGQSAGAWLRGLLKAGEKAAPEAESLDLVIAAVKGLAVAHLA